MDRGKDEPHGDLLVWREMLAKAATDKKPIIFVTDDRKEDWWLFHKGKQLGPRTELLRESRDATGQLFWLYLPAQFLKWASEHVQKVTRDAIREAETVQAPLRGPVGPRAARPDEVIEYMARMLEPRLGRRPSPDEVYASINQMTARARMELLKFTSPDRAKIVADRAKVDAQVAQVDELGEQYSHSADDGPRGYDEPDYPIPEDAD